MTARVAPLAAWANGRGFRFCRHFANLPDDLTEGIADGWERQWLSFHPAPTSSSQESDLRISSSFADMG